MSASETTKQTAVRLRAGATEIVFLRAHDRWRHVVALANGSQLESVEGPRNIAADPRWPASPALTDVSLVGAAGRPAVVGLGLAGRSHFSVSVAAHPDRPDTLLFEVACRIQEPPGPLGSTYTRTDGSTVQVAPAAAPATVSALPRTVEWQYTIGPAGLRAEAGQR
jgi:hypothetical protein